MKKIQRLQLSKKLLIGRNEWCQMPTLNLPAIKAKIDTGAKTSAIHAFNITPMMKENKEWVNFDIHPIQGNEKVIITCSAPIFGQRYVMSSSGHKEHRYVIITTLKMGELCWEIELTLSNRDPLRYRMLLGRQALNNHVLVDPGLSCYQGVFKKKDLLTLYGVQKI